MLDITEFRKADHDIDPKFVKRWSPRAFLDKDVPEKVLYNMFEAARWAPSAANKQPWEFIFARSEEDRKRFLSFIYDGNTIWCKKAPVLVAVVSQTKWSDDSEDVNPTHAFDTGASWGFLAMEAVRQGLITHGMGGFDRIQAKETLNIPDGFTVLAIIAVGYHGETETLPEKLQEREKPSNRKPIEAFISEGLFSKKD